MPTWPVRISQGHNSVAASCSFIFSDIVEDLGIPVSSRGPATFKSEFLQSFVFIDGF